MPKLGQHRTVYVTEQGDEKPARVVYRDATAREWCEYQRRFAVALAGKEAPDTKAERETLTKLCVEFGDALVVEVDGFEVPEGMSQREALTEYGGDVLAHIGQVVFNQNCGRSVLSKAPEPPSARTTRGGSAGSNEKRASTSPS